MELFLTSQASEVLDSIATTLPAEPHTYTVALITTAAKVYENPWWLEADKKKLLELGFKVQEIDIDGKSYEELTDSLRDCKIIFVAGGNTLYLWEKIKETGFDEMLKERVANGVVYIGSSAGSVITGTNLEVSTFFDERGQNNLTDFSGLGFIDFVPLPHYHGVLDDGANDKVLEMYKGAQFELRPMTDVQYFHIKDSKEELIDVS